MLQTRLESACLELVLLSWERRDAVEADHPVAVKGLIRRAKTGEGETSGSQVLNVSTYEAEDAGQNLHLTLVHEERAVADVGSDDQGLRVGGSEDLTKGNNEGESVPA